MTRGHLQTIVPRDDEMQCGLVGREDLKEEEKENIIILSKIHR